MDIIPSQDVPQIIAEKEKEEVDKNKELVESAIARAISHPMYWDERDKYTEGQRELLKRVSNSYDYYGSKVVITELGTVCERVSYNGYSGEDLKEILFDDYIKNIEKKVLKEEAKVKYDKETNGFYLIDKEDCTYSPKTLVHVIDINKESMENYAFGKYDRITSKLHELYLKSMSIEERQTLEQNKEEERQKIIAKTTTGHELLTPAEARVYLDYLEELKRENDKEIKGQTKKIAKAAGIPLATGTVTATVVTSLFADATMGQALLCGVAMVSAATSLTDLVLAIKTDAKSDWFFLPGGTITNYVKNSLGEIKEKKQENKIHQVKIDKLREIENVDRMVMAKSYSIEEFDKTLEDEEKIERLNLKNSIMKNLDDLANRINLINPEDKVIFLNEVKEILIEYTERYNNIINQDKNVIDLNADSYVKLKVDTLAKIADVEMRLLEVRQKDVEIKHVTDESKLLTDKIEGFAQLDNLDLELQKVHDNTNKKVKVKKLTKKNN